MGSVCLKHNKERDASRHCPECRKDYTLSEKGRKAITEYENSKKRKESKKRNRSTDKTKYSDGQRQREYLNTPEGRLKYGARNSVHYAIKRGNLTKLPCQICGNPKSEAHHYLGHSKEHRLHVVFLCKKHHYQADHDPVFNEELKSKAPVE